MKVDLLSLVDISHTMSVSATSSELELTGASAGRSRLAVTNKGAVDVLLTSAESTGGTAVFPTAGSPQQGVVVPAGETHSWQKPKNHNFLLAIRESTETANIRLIVGDGE